MINSIDRIRAKIADLEARIADLRIAERELEALDTAPGKPKAKAKRKSTAHAVTPAPQTVGAAITEVDGSHVIMISQPQAVADVIEAAIAKVG